MCPNRGMARGASFLMKQLQKNTKIAGDLSPLSGRFWVLRTNLGFAGCIDVPFGQVFTDEPKIMVEIFYKPVQRYPKRHRA